MIVIKKRKQIIFAVTTTLVVFSLIYLGTGLYRSNILYNFVTTGERGWAGDLFTHDETLGFRTSPSTRGYEIFPGGKRIPVEIDKNGFRTPVDSPEAPEKQKILFLGGSFTFGAAVRADKTFPEISAARLGARAMNAGVPSYGLAHMTLLGEQLIRQHKPDVVVAQYSPWLVKRAMKVTAVSNPRFVPAPYFSDTENGMKIIPLQAFGRVTNASLDPFFEADPSFSGFLRFSLEAGLPIIVQNDLNRAYLAIRLFTGLAPSPTSDAASVIEESYARLQAACKDQGASMTIMILGSNADVRVPEHLFPNGAAILNAQDDQIRRLRIKTSQAYARQYFHWQGSPPRLVDIHPNEKAHKIIALSLARHLEKTLPGAQSPVAQPEI